MSAETTSTLDQMGSLIFAWYLSQVGVGQVRFFLFLLGILAQIRGVPADVEKRVPPTA